MWVDTLPALGQLTAGKSAFANGFLADQCDIGRRTQNAAHPPLSGAAPR
jgi:hypothetical protein